MDELTPIQKSFISMEISQCLLTIIRTSEKIPFSKKSNLHYKLLVHKSFQTETPEPNLVKLIRYSCSDLERIKIFQANKNGLKLSIVEKSTNKSSVYIIRKLLEKLGRCHYFSALDYIFGFH